MIGLELSLHNDKHKPYMVSVMYRGKLSLFMLIDRALLFTLVMK